MSKISAMDWPLYWRLPPKSETSNESILDRFLDYIAFKNLELYPAQEEAILELLDGKNVILNTPTGSGKSLVALALHFQSLARGQRSIYTCPIKALVNEKFRDLCADFGPDQVGMVTGDGSINAQAPIICCTAEILSNMALRDGEYANVHDVIMDEFHYYSDKQRGVAWQVPLLTLNRSRFLLMSATLGDMDFFAKSLKDLTGVETSLIRSSDRPVPLDFEYRETPLHQTVGDLIQQGLAPVYLVNFSQREAAEEAQNLMSVDFSSKEEKQKIIAALEGVRFHSPYGKEMQKLLRHGIGLHHAGLLPKYRVLVERLAQQGLLKVISGTDTLGVGVNVPIRTVLLTKLCKYDGEKTAILSVREFQQISGRAGRRGYDTRGAAVAQAPAHMIENQKLKEKAAGDPKKLRKIVMKTPPPHGFVMWSKETFNRLITANPEPLVSRFQMTHGMLLNVLSRRNGFSALKNLIHTSHGDQASKKHLRKKAFELFRSLLDRKIVEYVRSPEGGRPEIRINMDLQEDFSLNQTLALYLLDTLQVLDVNLESYAVDLLTLVESILESPDLILRKQLDRVKTLKMAEMKAAGMEYDERMEELEKLEHPKPNRDFIYETFNIFSAAHPWVGQENIRPKSIAREMFENFHSFPEYIREYDLQRVEGLLLRYLSEVYKVLVQTVPDAAKNDEVRAMQVYFGAMVRDVDSSLLDDWEKLRQPPGTQNDAKSAVAASIEPDIIQDKKGFSLQVRNTVYGFVRSLASGEFEEAMTSIQGDGTWSAEKLESTLRDYFAEHQRIRLDPGARHPSHSVLKFTESLLNVEQRLLDPDGHDDWVIEFEVPLQESKDAGQPVLKLISIHSL